MKKKYTLIPLFEITKDAREIAVAWIEGYEDWMKSDLPTKHKLASDIMNYANEQTNHLTAENTRLREAIQYYFDVLEEVRGDTWKDRPDHVLKKMIDAMNKQPSPKSDKS